MVDIVIRGDQELDELAFGPDVYAEELGQFDWPRPSWMHVPARLWRSRAPPPDEGAAALDDAFELGYASPETGSDATSQPKVTGCCVKYCEKDLAVLGRRLSAKPLSV